MLWHLIIFNDTIPTYCIDSAFNAKNKIKIYKSGTNSMVVYKRRGYPNSNFEADDSIAEKWEVEIWILFNDGNKCTL